MANSLENDDTVRAKEILSASGIKLGIPELPPEIARRYEGIGWEQITVPNSPHVFQVQNLDLDRRGKDRVSLSNVMVMLGHGFQNRDRNDWRFFGNNRPVTETTRAYEDVAIAFDFPPVDVILACRGNIRPPIYEEEVIYVYPKPPIIVGPSEFSVHIHPTSIVTINSSWKRNGDGVEYITANAMDWQGTDSWDRYWKADANRRAGYVVPGWAKHVNS